MAARVKEEKKEDSDHGRESEGGSSRRERDDSKESKGRRERTWPREYRS